MYYLGIHPILCKYFENTDTNTIIKELLSLSKTESDFFLKFCELCIRSKDYPHGSSIYINNQPSIEIDMLKQAIDKTCKEHVDSLTFLMRFLHLHREFYPYIDTVPYIDQESDDYCTDDVKENPHPKEKRDLVDFSKTSNYILPMAFLGSVYVLSKKE